MNCWEYKNCAEEVFKTCPAYPRGGTGCWAITGVKCRDGKSEFASLEEQVANCGRCGFYTGEARKNGGTS